jgi:hypothetical protein
MPTLPPAAAAKPMAYAAFPSADSARTMMVHGRKPNQPGSPTGPAMAIAPL